MLRSAWPIACELVGLCGSLILPLWLGNVCSDSQLPSRDRARMDCTFRRAAVQGLARDAARPVAVARKAHLRRFIRVHRLLWSAALDRQVLGRPPTSGAPTPKGRAAVRKFRSESRRTATGPKLRGHDGLHSATTRTSRRTPTFYGRERGFVDGTEAPDRWDRWDRWCLCQYYSPACLQQCDV